MVMHNVDVLKEGSFDLIVTPCSSCTETIRSLWPKMAGKMPYKYRDAINELSQKADGHQRLPRGCAQGEAPARPGATGQTQGDPITSPATCSALSASARSPVSLSA